MNYNFFRFIYTGKGMAFSCFIEYLIAKSVNREMKDAQKKASIRI